MTEDLFIVHAEADNWPIARPLAFELVARGLDINYKDYSVQPNDPSISKILHGMTSFKLGVILISPRFTEQVRVFPPSILESLAEANVFRRLMFLLWDDNDEGEFTDYIPDHPLVRRCEY